MEFRVLGPIEAVDDGRSVDLGGARQRALLALLLLNANEIVSSERLVDELWSEEPPQTARTALRVRISQLRKAVGEDTIVTRPPGYAIRVDDDAVDLRRFERLTEDARTAFVAGDCARAAELTREALALWRGPALADVADLAFARNEILRLEELRLVALERRIDAELALGRHVDLVPELRALAAEHSLREAFHRQLMLALYRSGRQADALDAYRDARKALVEELGIEPSDALRELERAILRQDPALDAAGQAAAQPARRAVLVIARDVANLARLGALAEALAREPARDVVLARLVGDADELAAAHRALDEWRGELASRGVGARVAAFTSAEGGADAARLAREQDVDLALVDATPADLGSALPSETVALLDATPCDVALLVARTEGDVVPRAGTPLLVPFSGADHDWAAIEVAAWLARATDARLVLAGAAADKRRRRRDASRLLATASLVVQQVAAVAVEPLLVPPGADGVVEASRGAALVVLGLSERWRHEGLGETRLAVARGADAPTLLVRRGVRPGGLSPPEGLTRFTWTLASGR